MNVTPLPQKPDHTRTDHLLNKGVLQSRRVPSRADLRRRKSAVRFTKYVLPVLALALLSLIALWPEFDSAYDRTVKNAKAMMTTVAGATVTNARYRGLDEHGRPYTVTAATATEISPGHISMQLPKADVTLANGTWMLLQSEDGVFLQHTNQLDLSKNVFFYRDDGSTMTTQTASIDLKLGAAASNDHVHIEGPTGTLDALGFTVVEKGDVIQFGPGTTVMNSADHSPAPEPPLSLTSIPAAPPTPVMLPPPSPRPGRGPLPGTPSP